MFHFIKIIFDIFCISLITCFIHFMFYKSSSSWIPSFINFRFHTAYISRVLCLTNSTFRLYVSQIQALIGSTYLTNFKFYWFYIQLFPMPRVHTLFFFYLSTRNEISESFIFLTNCFLSRLEKSLDRFSIRIPENSRISSRHANFLYASSSWRGVGEKEGKAEGSQYLSFRHGW